MGWADPKLEEGRAVAWEVPGTRARMINRQTGRTMTLGKGPGMDRGRDRLTLHVQLGPPAVTLNEDGGAQESSPAQGPDESAEHEREL